MDRNVKVEKVTGPKSFEDPSGEEFEVVDLPTRGRTGPAAEQSFRDRYEGKNIDISVKGTGAKGKTAVFLKK